MQLATTILYTIQIFVNFGVSIEHNLTFLPELKNWCPYTSFCEESAPLTIPENEIKQPCCKPCSCEPECEKFGNCCFDYVSKQSKAPLRKCLSVYVTYMQTSETNYIMVYSCPTTDGENSLCYFNTHDVTTFAPTVSLKTGEIYVNPQCASCNGVTDGVPWKLAVACPFSDVDYLISSADLFQKTKNEAACHLTYVPPENVDVENRECHNNIIRECNVTGFATKRTRFWDYCPMFNATFYIQTRFVYGNVFCFICNDYSMPDLLCGVNNQKGLSGFPFIVMLEEIQFEHVSHSIDTYDRICDESFVKVHSLTTECRQVICPWGQFRIAGTCGYHSNKWVGGSFSVILKVSPLLGMPKINISFLDQPEIRNDTESHWLKRTSLKAWDIETLYKPTVCGQYVEHFVVLATNPYKSVNPSKLKNTLDKALLDTWYVEITDTRIDFSVELNPFQVYVPIHSSKSYLNISINTSYVYLNEYYHFRVISSDFEMDFASYVLYDVIDRDKNIKMERNFLKTLFFCEQIELYPDEYVQSVHSIWFKATNKTLYASDYMVTNTAMVRVCLNQFPVKNGECESISLPFYFWLLIPGWILFLNTL